MNRSNVLCRVITVFAVILEISAVNHWYVTENGRIEPQHDSVFDMRRPYDLVVFLEQEKRRDTADDIYEKISEEEVSIDNQFMGLDMADIESSNSDCLLWNKSLVDVDIYASIVIDHKLRDGIDQSDYMLYNVAVNEKQIVPDCQSTFLLDFSIYTFEHLKAMQNRKSLTQHEELSLMNYLSPDTDLDQFGHQLAYSLSRNKTSWIYLNLASIYWRIKGNAYNALECSRRAIVCAPRQYRDIPLLTTAGILHAAKYSGEAAIILHAAIDQNPTESYHHLALGHVYASLGDYNRSVACYDNCLKLAPDTAEAKQIKYAILCHGLLERSLLLFDQRLRNVLSDIHAYHDWKQEWFKLYERMLREQNLKSATREIKLALAREQSLHLLAIKPMDKSSHTVDDNIVLSYTELDDRKKVAENMLQNVHLSLNLLKSLQEQAQELHHVTRGSATTDGDTNAERSYLSAAPAKSRTYAKVETKKGSGDFEAENWPEISDCDESMSMFGDTQQYLPVYLSPEDKRYATHLFVNELIDVEPGKNHPLPWRPPTCQTPKSYNDTYITRVILNATARQHSSDILLKPFLLNLAETANLAEIGQRIYTATERKVTSPWVLSMFASLYWRVVGKPRLALDCLQLALDDIPYEVRDVPLVSIASIHHKMNLINDALRITEEALQINSLEPMTNFLFGILLNVKGNYTGAMHYLKQALRVDPHFYDGRALMLLKILACREKFNVITGNETDANYWSNYKVELPDESHYIKEVCETEECMRQDSMSLRNSTIKLPKLHMEMNMTLDNIFHLNSITNWHEPFESIRGESNRASKDSLHSMYNAPISTKIFSLGNSYIRRDKCDELKHEDSSLFVFQKFLGRGMSIKQQMESLDDDIPILKPTCKRSIDDKMYHAVLGMLQKNIEPNVIEWLIIIAGTEKYTLMEIGSKIAFALQKNCCPWNLSIAASFYWRALGDSRKALDCLYQSVENMPGNKQDIFFLNMASLLSTQGHFSKAFMVAELALQIDPNFVVNHYVIANLHAIMGNFAAAEDHYSHAFTLDSNFKPSITRLQVLQCCLLYNDKGFAMLKILLNIL